MQLLIQQLAYCPIIFQIKPQKEKFQVCREFWRVKYVFKSFPQFLFHSYKSN